LYIDFNDATIISLLWLIALILVGIGFCGLSYRYRQRFTIANNDDVGGAIASGVVAIQGESQGNLTG
jgi:hypothetical protein